MCTVGAMTFVSSYRCVDGGAYCNCDPDAAQPDATTPDAAVGTDTIAVADAPQDAPGDIAASDVPRDAAAVADVAPDVPADAATDGGRVSCGEGSVRCRTHEDCVAACLPRSDGRAWCCILAGECGGTPSGDCPPRP